MTSRSCHAPLKRMGGGSRPTFLRRGVIRTGLVTLGWCHATLKRTGGVRRPTFGCDTEEVVEQAGSGRAALLGMELRRHHVVARADRGKALAVFARCDGGVGSGDAVRVEEVRPRPARDPVDERVRALDHEIVPAHVRDAGCIGEAAYLAGEDTEAEGAAVLVAGVEQHLHTDADPEKRSSRGDRTLDRPVEFALA